MFSKSKFLNSEMFVMIGMNKAEKKDYTDRKRVQNTSGS
jgi:hypothetical protein